MASCNSKEAESVHEMYKKENTEKSKIEFEIFNDRFQKGKNF